MNSAKLVSKYRGIIYGISILLVVGFHIKAYFGIDVTFGIPFLAPLRFLVTNGRVGVDIFLFMSGVCLFFSFCKKEDPYGFITRRFRRILIPTFVVYTGWFFYKFVILKHSTLDFLTSMTLMRFWWTGDNIIWFVSLVLVLYLLYPYIYYFSFKTRWRFSGVVLVVVCTALIILFAFADWEAYAVTDIALARIPIFLIGCVYGRCVYEDKKSWIIPIIALLSVVIFVVYFKFPYSPKHTPWSRLVNAFGGFGLAYLIAYIAYGIEKLSVKAIKPIDAFFSFFGNLSFEIYLSHIMVYKSTNWISGYEKSSILLLLLTTAISLLLAIFVGKLNDKIWEHKDKVVAKKDMPAISEGEFAESNGIG